MQTLFVQALFMCSPYSLRLFSGRGCGYLLLLVIFFSCKGHWLASFLPSICAWFTISIDSIAQPIPIASPPIAGESSKVPQRHSLSLKRAAFTLIERQAMLIIRHSKDKGSGIKKGQEKARRGSIRTKRKKVRQK